MKTRLPAIAVAALIAVIGLTDGASSGDFSVGASVTFAPLSRSYSPPALGRRQGWLTISNRDWYQYSIVLTDSDKMYIQRDDYGQNGGITVPSGATVTVALEKETYDLYGSTGERLRVRVREGRTTTLSLEPFGYVGSTGLNGSVNDGDRIRTEVLIQSYNTPPIVVQPTPPIIVERPRPPIVITPPPVHRPPPPPPGPGMRPPPGGGGHRPPPPPPPGRPGGGHGGGPGRPGGNDGWSIIFGFGKGR